MNSFHAKQKLGSLTEHVSLAVLPPLACLVDWAEQVHGFAPPPDLYNVSFQVSPLDDARVFAGCAVLFSQTFSGQADRDCLSLYLERGGLSEDDPIRRHDCYLSLRNFPDAAAFFAAVRAHPSYQFACSYPFETVSIYCHPAAEAQG